MNYKGKTNKKPEWVSSFVDQDRYKLSQAELMQKKISLMSKHRMEVKDQWQNVQEKLKNNIVDDETQKIYLTALQSKGLNNSTSKRRNLTQMIEWEKSERQLQQQSSIKPLDVLSQAKALLNSNRNIQNDDPNFIDKIKQDLEETKNFVNKAQKLKQPDKILKHEQQKQYSQIISDKKRESKSKQKSQNSENEIKTLKNLDNVISFLENTLTSQEVQISQTKEENPFKNAGLLDTKGLFNEQIKNKENLYQNYEKLELFNDTNITQFAEKIQANNQDCKNIKQNNEIIKIQCQGQEVTIANNQQINNSTYSYQLEKEKTLFNLNQQDQQKNDYLRYDEFQQELNKTKEDPGINVQQKLNFDKCSFVAKSEISFDDNIDQLKLLLEQTRQELNQMNLQESNFMDSEQQNNNTSQQQQTQFYEQQYYPKQCNYQQIYKKYKNCDTFDINDHLM